MEVLTVSSIRTAIAGKAPRIHPNGFIQVDLDGDLRLHVWPTTPFVEQPTIDVPHTHSFDLESFVLVGHITNVGYDVVDDLKGDREIYRADAVGEIDEVIRPLGRMVRMRLMWSQLVQARHHYSFGAHIFHRSVPKGLTATLMKVTARYAQPPLMLFRRGEHPVIRKAVADLPDELWPIINRALAEAERCEHLD